MMNRDTKSSTNATMYGDLRFLNGGSINFCFMVDLSMYLPSTILECMILNPTTYLTKQDLIIS